MIRLGAIVLKADDVHRAQRFWAGALGYPPRDDPTGDAAPALTPPGGGPEIVFDADDRTHLDLFVTGAAELRSEVDRLVALGARRVAWTYPEDARHVVLADPDGNLFCVVDSGPGCGPS
jgi:catechol 2,3-dioxygenase-like lactoylglutathione lyase family enzyme